MNHKLNEQEKKRAEEFRLEKCGSKDFNSFFREFDNQVRQKCHKLTTNTEKLIKE